MTHQKKHYQIVGLGGTFDHFHAGHEKFLKFASELSDVLIIGVSNQNIAERKTYPQSIESFAERSQSIVSFCTSHKIEFELIELSDSVGSTVTDNRIEALAVTTETEIGGEQINRLRKKSGLAKLPLHVCELLPATDGQALHSDRIRAGECDREGLVYLQLFDKTITISKEQRLLLAQPQGFIVNQPSFLSGPYSHREKVILVGDSTIERFTSNNWPFQIGIFDRKIERKPAHGVTQNLKPDLVVQNPAGSLTPDLAISIQSLLQLTSTNSNYIFVEGEEDLAAIPAVMLAPLGFVVYYGQPGVGLVELISSENVKTRILTNLV